MGTSDIPQWSLSISLHEQAKRQNIERAKRESNGILRLFNSQIYKNNSQKIPYRAVWVSETTHERQIVDPNIFPIGKSNRFDIEVIFGSVCIVRA